MPQQACAPYLMLLPVTYVVVQWPAVGRWKYNAKNWAIRYYAGAMHRLVNGSYDGAMQRLVTSSYDGAMQRLVSGS